MDCDFSFELCGTVAWHLFIGTTCATLFFCLVMFHCLTDIFAASHLEWSQYDEHCDEIDGRNTNVNCQRNGSNSSAMLLRFDYLLGEFVCDSPQFSVFDSFIRFYLRFPLCV